MNKKLTILRRYHETLRQGDRLVSLIFVLRLRMINKTKFIRKTIGMLRPISKGRKRNSQLINVRVVPSYDKLATHWWQKVLGA